MDIKLTLQEKLWGLRKDRKLKLADVSKETGMPTTTLHRFESDKDARIGYQDILVLSKFYDVSADYLFGLTDNEQYRNVEVDKLNLSDEAIVELISGKLNNRLLSEMIAHPDFAEFLVVMEVYVDRTITEYMNTINTVYKTAVDEVSKQYPSEGRDEHLAALKELNIDPDDYLRFRLSQRFDRIAKGIYDEHKKAAQSEAEDNPVQTFGKQIGRYTHIKKRTGSAEQAILSLWADQLGVDIDKMPDDERKAVIKFLSRSKFSQQQKKSRRRY